MKMNTMQIQEQAPQIQKPKTKHRRFLWLRISVFIAGLLLITAGIIFNVVNAVGGVIAFAALALFASLVQYAFPLPSGTPDTPEIPQPIHVSVTVQQPTASPTAPSSVTTGTDQEFKKIPIYIQQAITGLNSLKAAEREEAIQSLAKSDHPAAHEAMIEALEHPLKEIRIQMGLLLAGFQEPKAIPILIDTLHSKDIGIRSNAVTALTKVGLPTVPDLRNVLYDSDRNARLAAIQALGEIGDISATPDLLKMLQDIDEDVRVNTVEAFGKIKDNAALQALFEVLRDTKNNVRLHNAVISALMSIGNADAVPELSKCLLNDEDKYTRFNAAVALREIRNVAALPALKEALHDTAFEVRQIAANALGKIGDTSVIPALQEALRDSDSGVRECVVNALGEIGNTSALPTLIEALQDKDIVVIDRTLGALKRIGTNEALAAIQDWQNSKNID